MSSRVVSLWVSQVLPETDENGFTKRPVLGPGRVLDITNKLGLHPHDPRIIRTLSSYRWIDTIESMYRLTD